METAIMLMEGVIKVLEERLKDFRTTIRVLSEMDAEQTIPADIAHTTAASTIMVKPRGPYRKKSQAETPTAPEAKQCNKCGLRKTLDDYPLHKECRDGRSGRCKACVSEKARIRYQAQTSDTGPLPYACDECHGKFSSRAALEDHVEAKHP